MGDTVEDLVVDETDVEEVVEPKPLSPYDLPGA